MQILHLRDALFCFAIGRGSRMIPVIMTMVDPDEERHRLTKFYAEMSEGELQQLFDALMAKASLDSAGIE